MLEDVRDVGNGWLLVNELGYLQIREQPLQLVVGLPGHFSYQPERELLANHRERLKQIFLLRRQPVDARGQHPLYGGRNLNRAQRHGELDGAVAKQGALLEQRLHDLFHEKRVTFCFLDNHALERHQILAVVKQRLQHLLAILRAERVKPELRIIGLVAPVVCELWPVVNQHQEVRSAN